MSMNFQLFSSDDHWHNLEDETIHTWKDHFIGVISGTAAAFFAHLQCEAIPQR